MAYINVNYIIWMACINLFCLIQVPGSICVLITSNISGDLNFIISKGAPLERTCTGCGELQIRNRMVPKPVCMSIFKIPPCTCIYKRYMYMVAMEYRVKHVLPNLVER